MSASMAEGIAEVLSAHVVIVGGLMMPTGWCATCGHLEDGDQENHQAEVLAANGYGKLEDAWDGGHEEGWLNRDDGIPEYVGRRTKNPHRRPE